MIKNMKKKKKGFTLIELVIVLAVLAIIALIAIPNFNKVREDSQIKSDNRSLEAIVKVIEMEIIDGNILNNTSGTITVNASGASPIGTLAAAQGGFNTANTVSGDTPQASLNKGLADINEPQQKGRGLYVITLADGKVTTKVTTPAP